MKNILTNKWFKFSLVLIIYLLWAYWVGSWWLLILVPVIFDIYITKKVHWAFWKKKGVEKQTKTVEWIDALIFAVVAATLIRMFFFEAYTIPTSSMEKSMLVGDYLFLSHTIRCLLPKRQKLIRKPFNGPTNGLRGRLKSNETILSYLIFRPEIP